MRLYTTLLFVALNSLAFSFPTLVIKHGKVDPTLASLRLQKPIPTAALLAGILDHTRKAASIAEGIEEDYGDLGGERPVVKSRKGVWVLLAWKAKLQLSRVHEAMQEHHEDNEDCEGSTKDGEHLEPMKEEVKEEM